MFFHGCEAPRRSQPDQMRKRSRSGDPSVVAVLLRSELRGSRARSWQHFAPAFSKGTFSYDGVPVTAD